MSTQAPTFNDPSAFPPGGKVVTAPCRERGEPGLPEALPCYEG